jgi:para-nitrobenzyl esterase
MAPLRDTVYGPVTGVDDSAASGTYFWKGIPFAKPPVGALRWKAPVEPDPWSGPLGADTFGNASAQFGVAFGPGLNNTFDDTIGTSLNQAVGSEDSLYLNIWRPATEEAGLPVIFFIYGGSNLCGYSADPVYDGAALAKAANAVVVTANYRVGLFGWLSLPQLQSGDPLGDSGNFGLLDQLLSLQFVSRNIARFGGDPGNVTVIGQSAGAIDLYALLTSPLVVDAEPQLIHRAVLMSGGLALPSELPPGSIPLIQPVEYARKQGQALLHALLMADHLASDPASAEAYVAARTSGEIAAYLRSKTPKEIFRQLLTRLAVAGLYTSSLIPDGQVVARSPLAAIKAGKYLKVPILVSNTREEAKLFPAFLKLSPALGGVAGMIVDEAKRFRMTMAFDGDAPATLTEKDLIDPAYLPMDTPGTGYNARMAILNHFFFTVNRDAMLQALAEQQSNLWYYRFDWAQEPAPWDAVYGACHGFDLPFVFGNFGPSVFSSIVNSSANEPGRLALSEAMMGAITAFARKGDPNHEALGVPWPVWPRTLVFDATLTSKHISVQ